MTNIEDNSDSLENEENGSLNEFKAEEKSYDISQILAMSRGDDGFVKSLIKMFIVQTPTYIDRIVKGFESGDYKAMGETAHQLKQSVYAMRIHNLKKPVMQLVNAGKKNQFNETLPSQIELIKHIAALVILELKNDYKL
jgi:hypothetical protein